MADKIDILLCIYKDARDTVKHFDIILSNYRKIAFTFNSTIVAGYIGSLFNTSLSIEIRKYNLTIWLIVIVFNYLLWFLEKHYHKYLMFSAKVAMEIEGKLRVEPECALADRLHYASTVKGPYFVRFIYQARRALRIQYYDTIYLLPLLAVNVAFYFFMSKKIMLLCYILQLFLMIYLLSYDSEIKRKLPKKIEMGKFETIIKQIAKIIKTAG